MTRHEADRLHWGSTVMYKGRRHRVEAIRSLDNGGTLISILCLDSTCPDGVDRIHDGMIDAEDRAVQPDRAGR